MVLAKDEKIKEILQQAGYQSKTLKEVTNIEVHPARVLSHLYTFLGRSDKLGLSGRHSRDVGILTTSKLYKVQGKVFAFTPQRFDFERNYMDCDPNLMMTTLEYGLYYLSKSWSTSGRPTISLVMGHNMLENEKLPPAMLSIMKKLKAGYINGTRVVMGQYEQFLKTTCITDLSFLAAFEEGNSEVLQPEVQRYLAQQLLGSRPMSSAILSLLSETQILSSSSGRKESSPDHRRKSSIRGTIRRSRSRSDVSSSLADIQSRLHHRKASDQMPDHRSASSVSGGVDEEDDEIMSIFVSSQEEREKVLSQSHYGQHEVSSLVTMLIQAPSIEEQADILHYLVLCYGPHHKLYVNQLNKEIAIRDLMSTLYETALVKKNWAIVRQAAGFLGKRVEDLSKAVTDLLVRQKQVTVGLPLANNEVIVSGGAALKSRDLILIIYNAYRGDESMTMLTQELLVYLSMFIQTEPQLFHGMMRKNPFNLTNFYSQKSNSKLFACRFKNFTKPSNLNFKLVRSSHWPHHSSHGVRGRSMLKTQRQ